MKELRLGMAVSCTELANMIDNVDTNIKDTFVNYKEFVGLYMRAYHLQ